MAKMTEKWQCMGGSRERCREGAHHPLEMKSSSSYSLLKFLYLTSHLRHFLVVHPPCGEKSWIALAMLGTSESFMTKYEVELHLEHTRKACSGQKPMKNGRGQWLILHPEQREKSSSS